MDLSSLTGGGKLPRQEQKPEIEYDAQAVSPIVNGEVKLTVGEHAFTAAALFDMMEVPFAEVNEIAFADYAITVKTDDGNYTFSRMGQWARPFYDALCDALGKATLRALFVEGKPVITATGEYNCTENGASVHGSAPIHVYENSIVILPPDLNARRVPLCFVSGVDKGDYSLTLRLDTGESHTFSKLGYDTAPFADAAEKQIRELRQKALSAVKEIAPSLTTVQASQIARLMPEGAAAPIGRLAEIAPAFVAALETRIAGTRAAESYTVFKERCDPAQIWIGFRKNETAKDTDGALGGGLGGMLGAPTDGYPLEALNSSTGDGTESEEAAPDPYLLWMIAPSPDGKYAAVEFAEANSATFVYKTGGGFDRFARQINRALEAIDFRREVIRLSDEELRKAENADYYMAFKRTASLQFVRGSFVGRVIHSNPEAWEKKLIAFWNTEL